VAENKSGNQTVIERDERICTENNIGFARVAVKR
jgi:hypothetical protein